MVYPLYIVDIVAHVSRKIAFEIRANGGVRILRLLEHWTAQKTGYRSLHLFTQHNTHFLYLYLFVYVFFFLLHLVTSIRVPAAISCYKSTHCVSEWVCTQFSSGMYASVRCSIGQLQKEIKCLRARQTRKRNALKPFKVAYGLCVCVCVYFTYIYGAKVTFIYSKILLRLSVFLKNTR